MDKLKMMMELSAAAHCLNMAVYLLGESIEENREHDYDSYIKMAKENIAKAEKVE